MHGHWLGWALATALIVSVSSGQPAALSQRSFRLASAPLRFLPFATPPALFFAGDNYSIPLLAADVDVINFHLESYGVPWDVFTAATSPPSNWTWTQSMTWMAQVAPNQSRSF